jgi:GT2 family glycosyltransferase
MSPTGPARLLARLRDPPGTARALRRAARALREGGPDGLRRWLGRDGWRDSSVSYSQWMTLNESEDAAAREAATARAAALQDPPHFTLLLLAGDDAAATARAVERARGWWWQRWELRVLAAQGSPAASAALAAAEGDARISLQAPGLHAAVQSARPGHLALLLPEDELSPAALLDCAEALARTPGAPIVYGDHDLRGPEGARHSPFFKPVFDEELHWSRDLLGPLTLVRRDLLLGAVERALPEEPPAALRYQLGLRALLSLRAAEGPPPLHVPRILAHLPGVPGAQPAEEPALAEAMRVALREHLSVRWPGATVEAGRAPGVRTMVPPALTPASAPLVSALVPTRDGLRVLRGALEALFSSGYPRLEVLVIDNGSRDAATLAYLAGLAVEGRIRLLRDDGPFNFSALNNRATRAARGELLLLLNDDISASRPGWLHALVGHALRPEVGAAGARLLYPDGRVQHAGLATGLFGLAGHLLRGLPAEDAGPNGLAFALRQCSALTGACLCLRREVYLGAGGLDERLAVAFQDVDLCLRLRARGLRCVWVPEAELTHHESFSRGSDVAPARKEAFAGELLTMLLRYPDLARDPFYNPHLALCSEMMEPGRPSRLP